jgi:Na+-translocating ferredoxin:NAD+ oxidoreductase RNF subunit RnfB
MRKWIPIIDEDGCTGCNACVDECESQSLELRDKIAILDADTCCSSEACLPVCTVDCMHMEWVELQGNTATGKWQTGAEAAA